MRRMRKGQGLVEYGLLITLAVLAVILILSLLGVNIGQVYSDVICALSGDGAVVYQPQGKWNLGSDWKPISGGNWKNSWQETPDGQLIGNVDQKKGGATAIMLNEKLGDDFSVTLDMGQVTNTSNKNKNAAVWNGYGIFFRSSNPSKLDGYMFEIEQVKQGEPPYLYFREWQNGNQIGSGQKGNLAYAPVPAGFDLSNPGQIRLEVSGDTFAAYINGKKVLEAKDDTFKSGSLGLAVNQGSKATIKDMSVEDTGCER